LLGVCLLCVLNLPPRLRFAVLLLTAIVLGAVTLGIAWFLTIVLALVDTVCIANLLNRGKPVGPRQWF